MKKYYKTEDTIINLTNIRTIEKVVGGTGAKSNPYVYRLDFHYLDGDIYFYRGCENRKEMDEMFDNIFKTLTEENS